MTILSKYLDKLKHDQIFADIFVDKYDESHYGFVMDLNDELLLVEKFNNECNYDGISILRRENVTRIRWGGNDIISTSILIDDTKRVKNVQHLNISSIETALKSVQESYGHVTVYIQDSDSNQFFVGQIHEIDSESIVIHEFGTKGTLDRKYILLDIDDITRIDAGGQYETNLTRLFFGKRDTRAHQ